MKLNHANLPVADVPAVKAFFTSYFDFTPLPMQGGNDKFAILEGEDGFILNLMQAKEAHITGTESGYPKNFHIGFFVDTPGLVHEKHAAITAAGFTANEVEVLQRGGFNSVTFYCYAPGGILVEVSCGN